MSAPIKAPASYKKQDGLIVLSANRRTLSWNPSSSTSIISLNIATTDITNLQQTPATNAKAILKVTVQPTSTAPPESHALTFTSPTGRANLTSILEPLKEVIAARTATVSAAADTPGVKAGSGTLSGVRTIVVDDLTDTSLVGDSALQKSLLSSNADLNKLFVDAITDAPDKAAFARNFWAARIHLLRAHKLAKSQHQGENNVLSEVKPFNENGKTRLLLSQEQIHVIFRQHPIVRRVYNDLVPKSYSEGEFWSAFFVSHLLKKLKGERITDHDPEVPKIDKYAVNFDVNSDRTDQFSVDHVPRFLDLEGNEQNHSQQQGNAPDWTMKPSFHGKVPLLHVLNNMSERMMVHVAASDSEAHGPVGMDEDTFNELQLRDLERHDRDNRIMLSISAQKHYTSNDQLNGHATARKLDRGSALRSIQADIASQHRLPTELDEDDQRQANHATKKILNTVKLRVSDSSSGSSLTPNLPSAIYDSATMTHSTTVEFLRYFWSVYLSGDDLKANELNQWALTLQKSLERIEDVAGKAEKKRSEDLAEQERLTEQYNRQVPGRKRRKLDMSKVSGGRKAVEDLLAATKRAVSFAGGEYSRHHREQVAQQVPGVL